MRGDAHVGLGEHHLHIGERRARGRASPRASRAAAPCPRTPASAWPTPYQPGSMIRACAQENTQGIARRSSIRSDLVRLAGREPILSPAISGSGRDLAEEGAERVVAIDEIAIGGEGGLPRCAAIALGEARVIRVRQRWAPRGWRAASPTAIASRLIIGAFARAVFGGDHLALFGDADAALRRCPAAARGSPRRTSRRRARPRRRGRGTAASPRPRLRTPAPARAPPGAALQTEVR